MAQIRLRANLELRGAPGEAACVCRGERAARLCVFTQTEPEPLARAASGQPDCRAARGALWSKFNAAEEAPEAGSPFRDSLKEEQSLR